MLNGGGTAAADLKKTHQREALRSALGMHCPTSNRNQDHFSTSYKMKDKIDAAEAHCCINI